MLFSFQFDCYLMPSVTSYTNFISYRNGSLNCIFSEY